MNRENPWDWLQPHDSARFGQVIHNPEERARWCRAVLTGARGARAYVPQNGPS
jgi:hypothetical protein